MNDADEEMLREAYKEMKELAKNVKIGSPLSQSDEEEELRNLVLDELIKDRYFQLDYICLKQRAPNPNDNICIEDKKETK